MIKDISVLILTNLDWTNRLNSAKVCKQWYEIINNLKKELFLTYIPKTLLPERLLLQKIVGNINIKDTESLHFYFIPYFENIKINKSLYYNRQRCNAETFENYEQVFNLDGFTITNIIVRRSVGVYKDALKLSDGIFWTKDKTIFKTLLNDVGDCFYFMKITYKNDVYTYADVVITDDNILYKIFQSGRFEQIVASVYYPHLIQDRRNEDLMTSLQMEHPLMFLDVGLCYNAQLEKWLNEKNASEKVIELVKTLKKYQNK